MSSLITRLKPNQIIVVGTNLAGKHLGGAAAQAHKDFGLEWGVAEGISGQSYGFPTLTAGMKRFLPTMLRVHADRLRRAAINNPDKEFLLTPVGTGIAGYPYAVIAELFEDMPSNVTRVGWDDNK